MKKRGVWLAAVLCAALIGVSAGGMAVARAEGTPDSLKILDVYACIDSVKWSNGTATVASGESLRRENGEALLTQANGFQFKMRSTAKWADWKGLQIILGTINIGVQAVAADGSTYLRISSDSDWVDHGSKYITGFDETVDHLYQVTYEKTVESTYTVCLYIDGVLQLQGSKPTALTKEDWKAIAILNEPNSGADMVVSSTLEVAEEKITDILDYVGSAALAREGVTFGSNEIGFAQYDIASLLSDSVGITFKMQAAQSWGDSWKGLLVKLGGNDIAVEGSGDGQVYVSVATNLPEWKSLGGAYISLDVTEEHTFTVARVVSMNTDAYIVRVYIDGDKVLEVSGTGATTAAGSDSIQIKNNGTGCNMTIKSTQTLPAEFETEKVADVLDYLGDASLCSAEGKVVAASVDVKGEPDIGSIEWLHGNLQASSGVEFKFKFDSAAGIQDIDTLRIMIGTADIRFNYASGAPSFHIYNYGYDKSIALGSVHNTDITNFDPTAEHTMRIARVKAKNSEGAATRIYLDDMTTPTAETFDRYPLSVADGDGLRQGVRLYNGSGMALHVRSMVELPTFVPEKHSDILDFGGKSALWNEDGLACAPREWALESRGGWIESSVVDTLCGDNGIEFMFKAAEQWSNASDKLSVMFGSTEIRLNKEANNRISFYVYKWGGEDTAWGRKNGPWGAKHAVAQACDETQWHTLRLTQRQTTSGKGVNVRIYLDGTLVCDVYDRDFSTYAEEWVQDICVWNMSEKTVNFKTAKTDTVTFEEEIVQDLSSVNNTFEQQYNESALDGVEVKVGMRIINNVYTQEFAGNTNGLEFYFEPATAGQKWLTSGNELVYVETDNDAEAVYTHSDGKKYKETHVPWAVDWQRSNSVWGNIDYWRFPAFWIKNNDRRTLYHHFNRDRVITDYSELKLNYQLHTDFGTTTFGLKELPDGRLVANVYNRHRGLVLFDDVVAADFDSSAKHKLKIARAKADNNRPDGFRLRIWLDDALIVDVYDADTLAIGGEYFQHFLMDNTSGIALKVSNVRSLNDIKAAEKQVYANFDEADYSPARWADIREIMTATDSAIDAQNSIARIKELAAAAKSQIAEIWTLEDEAEFAAAQVAVKAALSALAETNEYYEPQQQLIDALLAAGNAAVDGADSFAQLAAIQTDYETQIAAVPTMEMLRELVEARAAAKSALETYAASYSESDYSADNYAEIQRIKADYLAQIDASEDLTDIEAMPIVAKSAMDAVESLAAADLRAKKTTAKAELNGYVKESDYTAENWTTVQDVISRATASIDGATTAADVDAAVAAAKTEIDAVEKVATAEKKGCGCGSAVGYGSAAASMLLLALAGLLFVKKRTEETR